MKATQVMLTAELRAAGGGLHEGQGQGEPRAAGFRMLGLESRAAPRKCTRHAHRRTASSLQSLCFQTVRPERHTLPSKHKPTQKEVKKRSKHIKRQSSSSVTHIIRNCTITVSETFEEKNLLMFYPLSFSHVCFD